MRALRYVTLAAMAMLAAACGTSQLTPATTSLSVPQLAVSSSRCIDGAGAPTATRSRSEVSEQFSVPSRWVTLNAVGDCHDGVWLLSVKVGSSPTLTKSFPNLNLPGFGGLTVTDLVPTRPGQPPAVLIRTAESGMGFNTYRLVVDRNRHLRVVSPYRNDQYDWGVGARGFYGGGFSCATTPGAALQLTIYDWHESQSARFITVSTRQYVLNSLDQLRPVGFSTSSLPAFDASSFLIHDC
jgi:hypothetical protein